MPRIQRVKGEFLTYHIVQRGNERKNLFLRDEDKLKFLDIVAKAREKYNYLVYAYCLMDNHVHLLINDNGNDISKLMKSINVSYVSYFNRMYKRSGHLFQGRFRSEIVADDPYLLAVSRYIHNNPVKAGIVEKAEEYRWSSYPVYAVKAKDSHEFLDTGKILGIFSDQKKKAAAEYIKFTKNDGEESEAILDIAEDRQIVEQENHDYIYGSEEAKQRIAKSLAGENISMDELLQDKKRRNQLIKAVRKNSSLSLKELGDLFGGLSESRISRIVRD